METINVDLLFEQNTFENIESIKSSLCENADKKKDELRQIVGQSYRGLISISNAIENMLVSCDNLSQDIDQLKNFCDQSKFSSKNKVDYREIIQKVDDRQLNESNLNKIRLKVIINSPNQILDSLNGGDVLTAAVLFRRTKHLCNQFIDEDRISFNTLNHQIIFLDKIYELIYQKYLEMTNYNNYSLNDQELLRTLFAICMIKAESVDQVILEFLSNRQAQCIELFNSQQEDVSSTLLFFFKIIFNTLEIVFNLFNSVDELIVPSITDQINTVAIDYTFLNRNEKKMLCKLFENFKIENFIKKNDDLVQQIEYGTLKWSEEIKSNSANCIEQFLQATCIDNLYESVDKVRRYFDERETLILKTHYYEMICKKKIDFWDYFLSSSFDAAWKNFLTDTVIRLFANLKKKIEYLEKEEETVLNVFDYIWSNDLNEDLNEMHKKYCGSTERVIALVNQTNEEFKYLLDKFLETNKGRKEMIQTGQKFKSYFYETFREQNDEFLVHVDNLIKSNSLKKEKNFNLAHLIRMLVLICPNYKQCFDVLNMQSWFRTKEFLLNISYAGYNSYINHIIDELVQLFYEELDKNQPLNCLRTSANWLEIEIKELIDDSKEVSTNIYIPKQVSLPLENLLTSLTIQLCRLSGHTLPNKLKLMILDELVHSLCTGYQKIYDSIQKKSDFPLKTTQTLQIYFDLLFIKNLVYHPMNNEQLKVDLQNIVAQFQHHIDPFDLHLFSPYIHKNIEQNKSSLSMILNYLLPQNLRIPFSDHCLTSARDDRKFKLKFNLL